MALARSTTTLDEDRVRVTVWSFPADGDETGAHEHEFDYVVVPVTGGTFVVTSDDGGTSHRTQEAGVPYKGTAGTRHNVALAGATAATFVEIELKR